MTGPERRALTVGAELDRLNRLRARRVGTMVRYLDMMPPAARAQFLMDMAEIDQTRRRLRELLGDQLGQVDPRPAYQRAGRHAAP